MIFVTVGTNEQGFERLVEAAATLTGAESVIVQYGSARLTAPSEGWRDYLSFAEMSAMMNEARCVVANAGVGSILLAHRSGKRPIVMPRRHTLGEAVDDHQVVLAERLSAQGLVTLVNDADALQGAISDGEHVLGMQAQQNETDMLAAELRGYLIAHASLRRARQPERPVPDDLVVSRPAAQAYVG
jgi:UDP-N-acetylglucosamine transferase subunit ALG13